MLGYCTVQKLSMADRVFWLNSALYIVDICFHSSQPMRDHASLIRLWVQGDNACKEVRNSFTGRWMTLLCQAGYFTTASHMHMEVGHTHEDIGCGCEITCTCVCVCLLKWVQCGCPCQFNLWSFLPARWCLLHLHFKSQSRTKSTNARWCKKDWWCCGSLFPSSTSSQPYAEHCWNAWALYFPNQDWDSKLKSWTPWLVCALVLKLPDCQEHVDWTIHWLFWLSKFFPVAKIRDWCRLMPRAATLLNAYRARKGESDRVGQNAMKVPQSFTFMRREGGGNLPSWIMFPVMPMLKWMKFL